jgi:hypothetical protein
MPTKAKIKAYWAERLVEMGKFDSIQELYEADYCFACGCFTKAEYKNHHTERAHIVPRRYDGPDTSDNLHLLCPLCHVQSETIHDEYRDPAMALSKYWEWFKAQNIVKVIIDLVEFGERSKDWRSQKKNWAMERARRRREDILSNTKHLKTA